MLQVSNLRVDYDNYRAVRDLSFEIGEGHVFGLIGPNGAGKTTTMRSIIGLLEPTHGEILVNGIDIREYPQEGAKLIGFMPDFPPMYEDLAVWEFLDLFAASYYVPQMERPEIIEKYLHLVGLWEKRDALIPALSRGMRQRLMLAKTLIPDPQVLMLDEPASGMDPHARADLKKILRGLSARGKSVLVSSHILSEMSEFCTAIGIMEKGKMVVTGTVEDVSRKVMGLAVLQVEILDRSEAFFAVLARDRLAGAAQETEPNRYEFTYEGEGSQLGDLLKRLIDANVPVVGFGRKKEGLEELFLKVGAREVS